VKTFVAFTLATLNVDVKEVEGDTQDGDEKESRSREAEK
jgi:hypothetical protein